jgi:predicted ATPase/DNA-binding SARP family transcriptional activator
MHVAILGPLEVTADSQPIEIGGARLRVLLVRLAMGVGRVVTVEQLADALWPEDKPADQISAVRSLVSRLRRALPEPSVLRSTPGGYSLDLPLDAVDAHRFDRLAREARRELAKGNPVAAVQQLRAALGLWRGPALADAARASFAVGYIAGLDEARLAATEDRTEAELASGHHDHLVSELSELAARHPLRERLQGLLLRTLCAEGRQAEALAGYEEVRRRLADDLGTDPGPELQQVHLAILQSEPEQPRGGNLRTPLSSFVGRAAELERVGELLVGSRLVTLVGPGGAGKTRLATTVGASITAPGGVWLVELAPVTDPADVHAAALGAFGLREARTVESRSARDTMSRLVEALPRAETVIVLDNCEHLIDAAARLAEELLGRCPQLRVLATSREPLGVPGETLCPVPPLEVPEPGCSVAQAMANPAVTLLAQRAAAVRPGFVVDDENVAAVVEICRRLDGLPLAIELAAALLRSLTAPQLAERLDDRFRLLTGGNRTALPRHQTLRAVVAWSWSLLSEDERRFAERLAVFPAGIALAAAERMCAQSETALPLLTALVDKSLLQIADGPGLRYRMLETIREFALERLADSGNIVEARATHAAYFVNLAETAEPHLRGREQLVWTAILTAERDNLVAALHFAAGIGDADTAIRLAAALSTFWTTQGSRTESVAWLRLALDTPGESPVEARTTVEAVFLINKALAGGFAQLQEIVEPFQPVVATAERFPNHPLLAMLEPLLALFTDDTKLGLASINRRLSHPDPWTRAALWMLRAEMQENKGDMTAMRRDMPVAVAGFREVGERFGLSQALTSLADAHLVFGDSDAAIEALREAIQLVRELDPEDDASHERMSLAVARLQKGDVAWAHAEMHALTQPGSRELSPHNLSFALLSLGDIARYEKDLAEAARLYEEATTALHSAPFVAPQFQALVLTSKAMLALDQADAATADEQLTAAANYASEASDMPVLGRVGVGVTALRRYRGDTVGAAETLGATEQLRGAPDGRHPDVMRLTQQLRAELGDAEYDAAYAKGLGLNRPAAIGQVRRR